VARTTVRSEAFLVITSPVLYSSAVSSRVAGSPFSFRLILLRHCAVTRQGSHPPRRDEWRVHAVTLSTFFGWHRPFAVCVWRLDF